MLKYVYCLVGDSITTFSNIEIDTPIQPIYLDGDDWFFREENGNGRVWNILSQKDHTEIEKRILKAIEWIGLAINERQDSIAFCQCAFAIESLLQDQKEFITKSITAQIGEYAAFIVGDDKESRKETESQFRRLYAIRSKIAHGEQHESLEKDLYEILCLSKSIVISFLVKKELKSICTVKELREWINEKRYS